MNKSRSGSILFIQIISSIGIITFLAKLALISTGSWLWLVGIFAFLAALLVLPVLFDFISTKIHREER